MNYLICYDIENNKSRNKLFEDLKDLGLLPIQKSVFYGKLLKSEKEIVNGYFGKYCKEGDKALIIAASIDACDCYGYEQSDFKESEFEIL